MKYLNKFLNFDMNKFMDGKVLTCVGCSEWKDYESGKHMGTKVETVIMRDNTDYGPGSPGANKYEKITVKVRKDVAIPEDAVVMLVNPSGTVYGEYRNQLSVTADDVQIHQQTQPSAAPRRA